MKPWHRYYQRGLYKLLLFYQGKKKLDHCPLCRVDNELSGKGGWGECKGCPWLAMTKGYCSDFTYSGTRLVASEMRSDYNLGLNKKAVDIALPQRIQQLQEWTKYWRECSD